MGFVVVSSCFLQPSLSHSLFSSSSSRSIFISSSRNAYTNRSTVPMASSSKEHQTSNISFQRRTILLLCISGFPLLQLRARALEGLATSKLIVFVKWVWLGFAWLQYTNLVKWVLINYHYDRIFGGNLYWAVGICSLLLEFIVFCFLFFFP